MKPSVQVRYPHRVTWSVFVLFLVFAILFVLGTASQLPLTVASHFDAAGQPNAFMSRGAYIRFVLCIAVGLPALVVAILWTVYSRATDLKLPNRDYWLAPARLDRTRAFLIAFLIATAAWIAAIMFAFRRPARA